MKSCFDGTINTNGTIKVGTVSGPSGWTDNCVIAPAVDMTAVGNITGGHYQ